MKLSEQLLKTLSKVYEPSAMIEMSFKGNDLSFKTDDVGNPVQLFIGKRKEDGSIKGERYARTLVRDRDGLVIKDHWDLKGKAT